MDVIKIQFKKQVKGVDAGEVELTWISPLKTKQYFIMDDYKYVIVVENIEVVVINVKKLITKGLAFNFSYGHGFRKFYEEGPERDHAVVKWFNGVFVLALLPLTDVKKKWDCLKTNVPSVLDKPSIDKFIKYFESHYMTGSFSGTWNHFDTVGPKTNNHVEG